jgi:hypothetical protein
VVPKVKGCLPRCLSPSQPPIVHNELDVRFRHGKSAVQDPYGGVGSRVVDSAHSVSVFITPARFIRVFRACSRTVAHRTLGWLVVPVDVDPINRIAGTGARAHGGEERGEDARHPTSGMPLNCQP